MTDTNENREFTRSPLKMHVEVGTGAGVMIECTVADISMNGVRVECKGMLPVGGDCTVSIVLNTGDTPLRVRAEGRIVRGEGTSMAIEFTKVDDESLEHLRALVLYNSPDADKADEEMQEHLGIKRLHSTSS